MILSELLSVIEPLKVVGRTDVEITGIQFDSRKVAAGNMFVAQVGTAVDGHEFIDGCVAKGAAAIVLSKEERIPTVSLTEHRTQSTDRFTHAVSHRIRRRRFIEEQPIISYMVARVPWPIGILLNRPANISVKCSRHEEILCG